MIAADVGSVFDQTVQRLGMKQMSRSQKDRGFERRLGMELVKSVDGEKVHLVSCIQWNDSSWATLRSFGSEPGNLQVGVGQQVITTSSTCFHPRRELDRVCPIVNHPRII